MHGAQCHSFAFLTFKIVVLLPVRSRWRWAEAEAGGEHELRGAWRDDLLAGVGPRALPAGQLLQGRPAHPVGHPRPHTAEVRCPSGHLYGQECNARIS
jgi:hypothetical protein